MCNLYGQDFTCETMSDKLNLVMITEEECAAKGQFFQHISDIIHR
jgi:hypothetical protein